jgi:acetyl esterase/lipase
MHGRAWSSYRRREYQRERAARHDPARPVAAGSNPVPAYDVAEARNQDMAEKSLAASLATVTEMEMGGVTVEDIRPRGWKDNGKVLVFLHGGGYCLFSARSTLGVAVPMAQATGLRIVSVNYTPAPRAHFEEIQQQIVSVFDALIDAGYAMRDIAIYGESAGGALTASTVLNLRDRGRACLPQHCSGHRIPT